jgi:hypothetical protein
MTTRWWAVTAALCAGAAIMTPGCGKKKTSTDDAAPGSVRPAAAADKGGGSAADIPECAAHFKRIADCGEAESLVTKRKDEIQKRLDKGSSKSIVAGACTAMDKAYKCKGDK